jgi:hypothetical protein
MNWSCTLCGSRNWPSRTTSCPLCWDYSDEKPFGLEDFIDEHTEPDNDLALTKTKPTNHEPTTVLPKRPTH